jgi:hypothetical protein
VVTPETGVEGYPPTGLGSCLVVCLPGTFGELANAEAGGLRTEGGCWITCPIRRWVTPAVTACGDTRTGESRCEDDPNPSVTPGGRPRHQNN